MKVVLFCGGRGMRLQEMPEPVPKPMATIGYRPLLWHLMKYYSYYGHREFILCLGYRADVIKQYFLNYSECVTNDFVLSNGGKTVQMLGKDIDDWKITFLDTGLNCNVGQRLWRAKSLVENDESFLANYADGLSDLPLNRMIDEFKRLKKVASFVGVKPTASFHIASFEADGVVRSIEHITKSGHRVNGGFFVLSPEIFDYMKEGEELVEQPFQRLIAERKLIAYPYDGFWVPMDTFKEKQQLDELYARGNAPWEVWRKE